MIKRKQFYVCECEVCGQDYAQNFRLGAFAKRADLLEALEAGGWVKRGRDWYCANCKEGAKP